MIVGESPSHREDEQGEVFLGKHGDYLYEMLAVANIPQERVWFTNVLKCRAPGKPDDDCVTTCSGYLRRELHLVKPKLVVLMGRAPLAHVLLHGTGLSADPLTQWIGKHLRRRDVFGETRFSVCYHPSHLLRNKAPEDEDLSVSVLSDSWCYVNAKTSGRPIPALPLVDLHSTPPPMWQDKSLWR